MADSDDPKAEASAEKAYAAAAEAVGDKDDSEATVEPAPVPLAEPVDEPVEFPAKPKRVRKTATKPDEAAPEPNVVIDVPAAAPVPKARRTRAAANPLKAAKAVKVAKPVAKRAAAKSVPAKPLSPKSAPGASPKPAAAKLRKPSVQKIKTAPPKAAPKSVSAGPAAVPKTTLLAQLKELPMDVTTSIKDAVSGAQEKAKEAYTKGSAAAAEYGEFAKGNVEAFVESGKILASGLQDLSKKLLDDGKAAFETATADVKTLTTVKSPADFFKLQTDLTRRNFDTAVAYTTKTGEAWVKLTSDAFAPLSARVNLAVEKLKKAA